MSSTLIGLIFLTGIFPFWEAWKANQMTTLRPAVSWAFAGWLAWGWIIWTEIIQGDPASVDLRYLAISLTGCAGVAVLGARRPGVVAWNFVIAGLLVVMLFLLVESRRAGDDLILNRLKIICLGSSVAVGILNYLLTRLGPAAILLALSNVFDITTLAGSDSLAAKLAPAEAIGRLMLALVPWAAYAGILWQASPPSEFDRHWLTFRNRFGMVWAQRLREQFNESAKHAGWPVILRWQGLRLSRGVPLPDSAARQEMLANLQALMKRFRRKGNGAEVVRE
jgi:hypothetical protein